MIVSKSDNSQILNKKSPGLGCCDLAVIYNTVMKMTEVARSCPFIYN